MSRELDPFDTMVSLLGAGLCGSGTYDDVAVRTDVGWRIARRVVRLRRESDLPWPPPRPARPTGSGAASGAG